MLVTLSLDQEAQKTWRRKLMRMLPFKVKPSHLTQAVAAGAGFNTDAALKARAASHSHPPYVLFDGVKMRERLDQFGYPTISPEEWFTLAEDVFDFFDKPSSKSVGYPFVVCSTGRCYDDELPLQYPLASSFGKALSVARSIFQELSDTRKRPDLRFSSYGLKHAMEEFYTARGLGSLYVPNGVCIQGALDMGLRVYTDKNFENPNVSFYFTQAEFMAAMERAYQHGRLWVAQADGSWGPMSAESSVTGMTP